MYCFLQDILHLKCKYNLKVNKKSTVHCKGKAVLGVHL
jgi:hypothetical protein